MKVRINPRMIRIERGSEVIVVKSEDYSDAYIADGYDIYGSLPYLVIKEPDGTTDLYPLDYWKVTMFGKGVKNESEEDKSKAR